MIYSPGSFRYGLIETGVPTPTRLNNSRMSSFSKATQPQVQSLPEPFPWMYMSPPSLVF